MRVVVAMDSFKGSLSSVAAGEAVRRGVLKASPDAEVTCIPIADGGEGTVDAYLAAVGGERVRVTVRDPLMRPIRAEYGIINTARGRTAVIEMAAASGLPLVAAPERNPRITSTFGTGELIRDALSRGIREIILGIGGSATNDGGSGMLSALGVRFVDADGKELLPGGAALRDLASINLDSLDARLGGCRIQVACDVDNPLCGERGASAVFSPQKGADEETVALLDAALCRFADVAEAALSRSARNHPGAGAAGGMGFALLLFLNAELSPGVSLLLDAARFDDHLPGCDFVITGEGATDRQTVFGKAPIGVAARAAAYQKPVFILSGTLGEGHDAVYQHGITAAFSIADRPMLLETAIQDAQPLLQASAERLARTIQVFLR